MENYKKTFTKIFIGQTVSLLTSAIVQYAIIWYITFETGSALNLALATIAGILPQIVLGPFAGVIVDRLDRKKVMMVSDGMIALATLMLGIIFLFGEPSLFGLYLVLLVRSLGATFHTPSFQASIPLLAPKEKLVQISGINQAINSMTLILAPILAGILYGILELPYIMFLDIIGALFGIGSIFIVKIPKQEKTTIKKNIWNEMKDGFLELKKSHYLFILTLFVVVIQLLIMPIGALFPLITNNYFHLQPLHASIVEVVFSVGMLIGGIAIGTWGGFKKKQYSIILSMLVAGILLILSGLVPPNLFFVFVILSGLTGITVPFISGIFTAILQIKIVPEKLGRVYSIVISMMTMATPIGLLVVAPLAETLGVERIFIIVGILMVLTCLFTLTRKTIQQGDEEEIVSEKTKEQPNL